MTKVTKEDTTRGFVARGFTWVEDVVYVGLGALLAISAVLRLFGGAVTFAQQFLSGPISVATRD